MRLMAPPSPDCAKVHQIEGGWIVTVDDTGSAVEVAALKSAYGLETNAPNDDGQLVLIPTDPKQPAPTTEAVRAAIRKSYARLKLPAPRLVKYG